MELVDRRVELDPIAGREQHRLIDGRCGHDVVEQLAAASTESDVLSSNGNGALRCDRPTTSKLTATTAASAAQVTRRCSWNARICSSVERSTLRSSTSAGTVKTVGAKFSTLRTPRPPAGRPPAAPRSRRRRDDADRDPVLGDQPFELVEMVDDQAAHPAADLRAGRRRPGGGPKAATGEAAVVGQRPTEVADPDDGDRPVLGQPEFAGDLVDEVGHLVADPAGAVGAEVGQVLAQLGRVDPGHTASSSDDTVVTPRSAIDCSARRYRGSRAIEASGMPRAGRR